MQPDMMRPDPGASDGVVSDVLASIRRLIAQDEKGRQLPGRPCLCRGCGGLRRLLAGLQRRLHLGG